MSDPSSWSHQCVVVTAGSIGLSGNADRAFDLVGRLPTHPRLAIVGSRAASVATMKVLAPIVAEAHHRGWSVVSGGALGIDGGVHRAALALDLAQVAVLPCGRDRLYPPSHASLFAAMAECESASLLFAQAYGTTPSRAMFASRNAIVVGLADAVVVAEAALRSGSTGTGRLALQRGRPVAAIAGSPGCAALIGAGARALPAAPRDPDPDASARLIDAIGGWLDELGGASPRPICGAPVWPEHLAWLATALRSAGRHGLTIDALPDPSAAVLAICEAELLGLVGEAAAGRWIAL